MEPITKRAVANYAEAPANQEVTKDAGDFADCWETKDDMVEQPPHYNYGNIECIEAIKESMTPESYRGYLKGNCMKYLWRYERKGKQLQDLHKAKWYLNRLITDGGIE